jgi:hypothetical protein
MDNKVRVARHLFAAACDGIVLLAKCSVHVECNVEFEPQIVADRRSVWLQQLTLAMHANNALVVRKLD